MDEELTYGASLVRGQCKTAESKGQDDGCEVHCELFKQLTVEC